MKFTEAQLEQAFIHLLQQEEMQHVLGNDLRKTEGNMVAESRETYGHIATEKVLYLNNSGISLWYLTVSCLYAS